MSISQEIFFTNLISSQLDRFKWARVNQVAYFRCPYCGDSKKNEFKTRGTLYHPTGGESLSFKCHNCGKTRSFRGFLKDHFHQEYLEFKLRAMRDFSSSWDIIQPTQEVKSESKTFTPSYDPMATWAKPVLSLPDDHMALSYVKERQIPSRTLEKVYYTENFQEIINSFTDKYTDKKFFGPMLVVLMKDSKDYIFGIQARQLSETNLRYITLKFDDSYHKIYGLDDVNSHEDMYATEGWIDSSFLPNSIAVLGGDFIEALKDFDKSKLTIIPDNEPRSKDTCKRIEKAISGGHRVCLWKIDTKYKDINDMVVKGGMSPSDVLSHIENNSYSGLNAKLAFGRWKKI